MKKLFVVIFAITLVGLFACPCFAVVEESKVSQEGKVLVQLKGVVNVVSPEKSKNSGDGCVEGYCPVGGYKGMHQGWRHGGGFWWIIALKIIVFCCVTSFIFSVIFWLTYKWIVVGKKPATPVKPVKTSKKR